MSSNDFLDSQKQYNGKLNQENLAFKINLQEFVQKVMYISNLENDGLITSEDAYQQIKFLWKQLKTSKKLIEIHQKKTSILKKKSKK